MRQGIKNGALYVGAVIGAGFATGREISQFFGTCSPFIAAAAGLMLGACCAMFMQVGRLRIRLFGKGERAADVICFICAITVFIAMFCAAQALFLDIFGFAFGGVVTTALALITVLWGTEKLKSVNALAVAAIVLFTVVIYFADGAPIKGGTVSVIRPVGYAALNVLPAALVMSEAGKTATDKDIKVAGICSGITFAVLLFLIQNIVFGSGDDMPMLTSAVAHGLKYAGAGLIFLAVYTTLLSTGDLLIAYVNPIIKDERLSALVLIAVCWPVSIAVSFKNVVAYGYTAVSLLGLVYLAVCICALVGRKGRRLFV